MACASKVLSAPEEPTRSILWRKNHTLFSGRFRCDLNCSPLAGSFLHSPTNPFLIFRDKRRFTDTGFFEYCHKIYIAYYEDITYNGTPTIPLS